MSNFKKETFLKILIAIGVVAIIVSAYIRFAAPYLHELSLQKLDVQRISALDSLNTSLQDAFKTNPKASFGKANTIYISLPSNDPICADLNLPSVPDGWAYHCVATPNLQNVDGTGWLPVNISSAPALPIDPINNPDTLNYYAFVVSKDTRYLLATTIDSKKHLIENMNAKTSNDPFLYEIGTDTSLISSIKQRIGYWPMNDGSGTFIENLTRESSRGVLAADNSWSKINCPLSSCLTLSDLDQKVTFINIDPRESFTLTVWVNLSRNATEAYEFLQVPNRFIFYIYHSGPYLRIYASLKDIDGQHFVNDKSITSYDSWHQVGFTYGYIEELKGFGIANILDGKMYNLTSLNQPNFGPTLNNMTLNVRSLYSGQVSTMEIYDYSLKSEEIRAKFKRERKIFQ